MKEYTFEQMLKSYWLTDKEVTDRVNQVLAERGQKYSFRRGVGQLIDLTTGQVIEDKVPLRKLADYFEVVKEGEIYENPPIDMAIREGKLVGARRLM